MARPKKPIELCTGHKSKAEKKSRKEEEKKLLTGNKLKVDPETKNSTTAYKMFKHVKKIFAAVGKDDELYNAVVNRYCILYKECEEYEELKEDTYKRRIQLDEAYNDKSNYMEFMTYTYQMNRLEKNIVDYDKQIMEKRKMMFQIEKENVMTIQASLRSIVPKAEEKTGSKMADFLKRKGVGGNV